MSVRTAEQKAVEELQALRDHAVSWAERLEHFASQKGGAMASDRLLHEIADTVRNGVRRVAQDIRDKL